MPLWLANAFHHVQEWGTVHPVWWTLIAATVWLVSLVFGFRILTTLITRRVIREVFGDSKLPTLGESAREIQQARSSAAAEIRQIQTGLTREVNQISQALRTDIRAMAGAVRNGSVPLTLAVETIEERQILEAMLTRAANVQVVVAPPQARSRRRPQPDQNREDVATAWTRILEDENEEGECPTTTSQPEPPPAPKKPEPKKKQPAKRGLTKRG